MFSGVLEKYPGLKIVTHHARGMIPYYADTAIYGNTLALMCAHAFFESENLVFGIDMPLVDSSPGIQELQADH